MLKEPSMNLLNNQLPSRNSTCLTNQLQVYVRVQFHPVWWSQSAQLPQPVSRLCFMHDLDPTILEVENLITLVCVCFVSETI